MEDIFVIPGGGPKIQTIHPVSGQPMLYQQLSVTTGAQSLPNIPSGCNYALLTLETDSVRYRDDGTAPTSTVGMPLVAGQSMNLEDPDVIKNWQVIQDSNATSTPILNISYYFKR